LTTEDGVLAAQKREVRRRVAERVRRLTPEQRALLDEQVRSRTARVEPLRQAACVMAYCPLPDEVQLLPLVGDLFDRKAVVGMPRVLSREAALCVHAVRCIDADCARSTMGILEPHADLPTIEPAMIQVVLVPGRVFTIRGERLGRGGGFYDRFLRSHPAALRVALCYEEQIEPHVPTTARDECVDILVTPERTVWTQRRPGHSPVE
jgi:5-formyltetrahydrofolate cyclo-ligase